MHTDQQSKPIYKAKYVITCVGCLSQPNLPDIYHQAVANFKGTTIHTSLAENPTRFYWQENMRHWHRLERYTDVARGGEWKDGKVRGNGNAAHTTVYIACEQSPLSEEYIRKTKENYARIRHYAILQQAFHWLTIWVAPSTQTYNCYYQTLQPTYWT